MVITRAIWWGSEDETYKYKGIGAWLRHSFANCVSVHIANFTFPSATKQIIMLI